MNTISTSDLQAFQMELYHREKAKATVSKYGKALEQFAQYLQDRALTKELLLRYRDLLLLRCKAQTVNGALTAINTYLQFKQMDHMKVKQLKIQTCSYVDERRELSKMDYLRLLDAENEKNERLYYAIMTLCSTGIRISELPYITVQAAKTGQANIRLKGKCRTILLPSKLYDKLRNYCRENKIREGHIFRTRTGRPVDRSNLFHELKRLCAAAKVPAHKVFPHNFRHLFARMFYAIEKNLAHLADVLGHSRIETTRIYVAVSLSAHRRVLNRMRLVQ